MKRRKFFQVASAGAAGLTLAAACKTTGRESGTNDSATIPAEVPDYRKTIKTTFSTIKGKPAGDRVIMALIGAGSWGTNLILEAANSGENIRIKYVCDVDDTRGEGLSRSLKKSRDSGPLP